MAEIPSITFQILGPNEGAAEGASKGLWFKLKSDPPPNGDLLIGLKVYSSNGEVKQSGVIMILKHESHSADFFYKTVRFELDVWMEILPHASLSNLEFPIITNEGYVIDDNSEFPKYEIGQLSKIVPYMWNGPDRGLWTDENR